MDAAAFNDLKGYLTSAPIFSKPVDGEELYLYLAMSTHTVSSVLICVAKGSQNAVSYVSKTLKDAKTRYSNIEILVLSLFVLSKKLCLYF